MVELRQSSLSADTMSDPAQYTSNFSGDVINFSVYLKRRHPSSSVHFLSATGNDAISERMRAFFSAEEIRSDLVAYSDDKTVGRYMIRNDAKGERTFTYQRSDSAAKKMFEIVDKDALSTIFASADYFYFSGITLAILDPSGREKLLELAKQCQRNNKTVIFDPNYRAALWQNKDQARSLIEQAYHLSDILISSNEDEQLLWEDINREKMLERLTSYNIDEIILTAGSLEVIGFDRGRQFQVMPHNVDSVVDTTSAGDAFNAGYIAARHLGHTAEKSVLQASKLAATVIGLPGAIIPKLKMPQL